MCIRDSYDIEPAGSEFPYCKTSDNKMADILSRYPPVEQENYSCDKNEVQILAVKYALPN